METYRDPRLCCSEVKTVTGERMYRLRMSPRLDLLADAASSVPGDADSPLCLTAQKWAERSDAVETEMPWPCLGLVSQTRAAPIPWQAAACRRRQMPRALWVSMICVYGISRRVGAFIGMNETEQGLLRPQTIL